MESSFFNSYLCQFNKIETIKKSRFTIEFFGDKKMIFHIQILPYMDHEIFNFHHVTQICQKKHK